jgi:ferredoxin
VPEPTQQLTEQPNRRSFLRRGALAAAAGGFAAHAVLRSPTARAAPPLPDAPTNELVRMLADLDAALSKPPERRRWVMVVDTRKCIGCNACTVACKAEVPTGPGGFCRRVIEKELPIGPRPYAVFKPVNCLQCDDPPCARAVPCRHDPQAAGRHRRIRSLPAARAVRGGRRQGLPLGPDSCRQGRHIHATNTPAAAGIRERNSGSTAGPTAEAGRSDTRGPRPASALLPAPDPGARVLPACVRTCIGGAMYFGDASDPTASSASCSARIARCFTKPNWALRPG